MARFYPEVNPSPNFPEIEEKVLDFWKKERIFEKSVEQRPAKTEGGKNNEFVFYDGPPFANGLPHYGHLLTGFVKDIFARYQTMRGKRVERRFGWDCHGLPAEMGAEKELGISGRQQILAYGMEKFNAHCRQSVMKYAHEWEYYVTRQARWVDFQNDYKTMDKTFMESVLWAFKTLYDKGWVYEAYRVLPYSWAAETPLSNFETRMDNSYRMRQDPAVTVAFTLKEKPKGAPDASVYKLLAWTTTPWTLPSNLALAVKADMEYACVIVEESSPLAGEHGAPKRTGGGKTAFATAKAQEMRKEPTEAEKKLWYKLNNEQLGYKFRRQQPIGNYIVDFYNAEKRLVVELDGGQHAENKQDETRTKWLEAQGLKVLRFWNNDVLQNIEGVVSTIANVLENTPHAVSGETAAPPQGGSQSVCYIFAPSALDKYENALGIDLCWNTIKGSNLLGLSYEPLFPYFKDHPGAFRVLDGSSFIEEGSGTGVVHMAPGFGEDDQRVCEDAGIQLVCPVDGAGKFTAEVFDLPPPLPHAGEGSSDKAAAGEGLKLMGRQVFETNKDIISYLKTSGHLIKQETIDHNYPHCWRTDQPLIYKAVPSWYVEVTKFRDRMAQLNRENINWIPAHIRDGLFGNWLEGARDWSISRNRFWGCPVPVWRSDNPANKKVYVFGSIAELEAFFKVKVEDLHRPFIDDLTAPDPEDPKYTLRRVEDVLDCWFESGSMPYAQAHYPFENKEWFASHFPGDFIVEYVGQTRGWFYTLMVLGSALFDKPPFLNCICHGIVLDVEGKKLSKRLNNYPDPKEIFDQFGADPLRWFMAASPVMRGLEMNIDKEGKFIRDSVRLYVKPFWNAYNFFTLYANADEIQAEFSVKSEHLLDRYILAKLREAVEKTTAAMDAYDTPGACEAITAFFEVLNNWYIRRNRDRFWKKEKDADKQAAYNTLYTVLHTLCRIAAPLLPLVTEEIYLSLTSQSSTQSVHLTDWPDANALPEDKALVAAMDRVQDACNAALSIRGAKNLRVRLPLAKLTVIGKNAATLKPYAELLKDEVNVKAIDFAEDLGEAANFKLQLNNAVLGKRLPEKMKQIIPAAKQGQWERLADGRVLVAGATLEPGEFSLLLEAKDKNAACAPLSTQDALVVLDVHITPELEMEGYARDVVRMVQQARKDANLNVSDRIKLAIEAPGELAPAIASHKNYIAEQVLAVALEQAPAGSHQHRFENTLEGKKVVIGFSLAA